MNQQGQEPAPVSNTANDIEWLTARQAAHRIQVHPRTIQDLVKRKQLPASRIGRSLRIRKADIDTYMENHKAE